ncbi:MAG: hypothetical protein GX640_04110 [Fibrobacter sp.]|nr:hypothetical protein [Fibrobacter sp.]
MDNNVDYLQKNIPIAVVGNPEMVAHLLVTAFVSCFGLGILLKFLPVYLIAWIVWKNVFAKAEENMLLVLLVNLRIPNGIVGKMNRAMPAGSQEK